jgi:DNA-binding transcriptional MerR regulator
MRHAAPVTDTAELLIGEFAQRCRLPVSTLRYYDRIGLLAPAAVDRGSGYRRYRADQLPTAELIARLRALGVAPQQIAEILAGGDPAAAALLRERQRVSSELERGRRRLAELDNLLAAGTPARYRVSTIELMERQVAVREFRSAFDEQEEVVRRAIRELRTEIRRDGQRRVGTWGATFPLVLEDTVDGFVFAPVDGGGGGLPTMVLPGGRAVTTVHRGGLDALSLAYLALFAEIDRLGASPVAPVIEEYLSLAETRADDPSASTAGVRLSILLRG